MRVYGSSLEKWVQELPTVCSRPPIRGSSNTLLRAKGETVVILLGFGEMCALEVVDRSKANFGGCDQAQAGQVRYLPWEYFVIPEFRPGLLQGLWFNLPSVRAPEPRLLLWQCSGPGGPGYIDNSIASRTTLCGIVNKTVGNNNHSGRYITTSLDATVPSTSPYGSH